MEVSWSEVYVEHVRYHSSCLFTLFTDETLQI